MSWTDDRVEILNKLWGQGLSGSQIASRLGGVTRNAVVAKTWRMGLKRGEAECRAARARGGKVQGAARSMAAKMQFGKGERIPTPSAPKPPKPPIPTVHVSTFTGAIIPRPSPIPPQTLPATVGMPGQPITIFEITAKNCCWPMNDGAPDWLFCGLPRDPKCGVDRERGYCTAHWRKSVQKEARRRAA
jgi:GcrA cell cycle regulator